MLLLHGLGVHSDSWTMQTPVLIRDGMRPIIPDLPGFGKSSWSGKRWSIKKAAEQVSNLIASLGIDSAHVVGISMGGVLAQQFAIDHAQQVRRLVLVNTFSYLRPKKPGEWVYFIRRFVTIRTKGLKPQADVVARHIFPRPDQAGLREAMKIQVLQSDERVYRAALTALGLYNNSRRLSQIAAPTLVITGACDTTVPLANQRFLMEKIPFARQIVIPNAGHAVIVDQPEAFNVAMMAFLNDNKNNS